MGAREDRDKETRRRALADLERLHNDSLVNAGWLDAFNGLLRFTSGDAGGGVRRGLRVVLWGLALGVIAYVVFGIAAVHL